MDRLTARLAEVAARRARMRRILLAAKLREELPKDIAVAEEDAGVVMEGRRLRMRWVRDPALAVLRDLAGALR